MCGPAGRSADGEGRREDLRRDANGVEDECSIQLDVGIQVTARLDFIQDLDGDALDRGREVEQLAVPSLPCQLLSGFENHFGSWIADLVNAVAKAHNSLATAQRSSHPGLGAVQRADLG